MLPRNHPDRIRIRIRIVFDDHRLVLSHVWNQRVQRPRQGRLDNHSGVTLFQGYCDLTID